MTEEKSREAFLARWSRRKREQVKQEPAKPEVPPAAPPPAVAKPAAPLPAIESLRPDSDFKPFMAGDVTPEARRAALKRLFVDAHFNAPDPFEPYSLDLTVAESIPEEMLKNLDHAKRLLIGEPEKAAEAQSPAPASAQPQARPPELNTELKNVPGKQDT